MLGIIERHRDRVIERAILPRTRWKPGELVGEVARSAELSARSPLASGKKRPGGRNPAATIARPCARRTHSCKALKAEGVEHVFGIPGGANLPTYDALYDAEIDPHPGAPRAGRRPRGRGLREGLGPGRGRARDLGPGRDQPRHRDRRRDDGLGADRVHHRPGAHRPDRHRRLPGGRRHRDHDAGRQALDAGHRPAPDPRLHPRRLPHRLDRPPGPGAGRRPAGPLAGRHRVHAARGHAEPARLQAADRGQHQADPDRGEGARQRAPAGDLRRRRDRQRQRLGGVPRVLSPPTSSR